MFRHNFFTTEQHSSETKQNKAKQNETEQNRNEDNRYVACFLFLAEVEEKAQNDYEDKTFLNCVSNKNSFLLQFSSCFFSFSGNISFVL